MRLVAWQLSVIMGDTSNTQNYLRSSHVNTQLYELTEEQLLRDIRAAIAGRERPAGYYTISEWADMLALPTTTVARHLRRGTLPGYVVTSLDNVTVSANGKQIKTTVYKIESVER